MNGGTRVKYIVLCGSPGSLDNVEVVAANCGMTGNGALVFTDDQGRATKMIAAGQWASLDAEYSPLAVPEPASLYRG